MKPKEPKPCPTCQGNGYAKNPKATKGENPFIHCPDCGGRGAK